MDNFQPHIKLKSGDIGKIVLLPGDPARVLTIAKFLNNSRKVMQNREFTTYRGNYKDVDITVTSTGIGCPSTAIAAEELANIGAKVLIRIGTCGTVKSGINSGDLIIPSSALGEDGTTKEYINRKIVIYPSSAVLETLKKSAQKSKVKFFVGKNRTHDAFYESTENFLKLKKVKNLVSSEMECSVIFAVAKIRGLKAGAILTMNTIESFDLIEKNPNAVYALDSQTKVNEGVLKSIKVALDATLLL